MQGFPAPCLIVRGPASKTFYTFLLVFFCMTAAMAGPQEDTARGMEAFKQDDLVEAIQWFRAAAETGYAPAQARLAYVLDKAEENEEAVRWYRKAAEQGDLDGKFGLGQMYATGEGVEPDAGRALQLISEAAEEHHVNAMHTMALSYEKGDLGLPVDYHKALVWLERGADQGDRWSIERLVQIYQQGQLGVTADLDKAKAWEKRLPPSPAEPEKGAAGRAK